jgi:hypothetical protein
MAGDSSGEGSLSALSLNSMQLAIISLKEKYSEKHNQAEMLECERNELILSQENLYNELKKLHQANEKLTEQNLKLSTDLKEKSKECDNLYQSLKNHGIQDYSRLSEISDSNKQSKNNRCPTGECSSECKPVFTAERLLENLISSKRLDNCESPLPSVEENSPERILVEQVANNFASIRNKIKGDQVKLMKATLVLQENKEKSDRNANMWLDTVRIWCHNSMPIKGTSPGVRKCPMCEAEFPMDTSQDEFEVHVVEHFSCDESETLKNFDTLPDAYWKGKNDDSEGQGSAQTHSA